MSLLLHPSPEQGDFCRHPEQVLRCEHLGSFLSPSSPRGVAEQVGELLAAALIQSLWQSAANEKG